MVCSLVLALAYEVVVAARLVPCSDWAYCQAHRVGQLSQGVKMSYSPGLAGLWKAGCVDGAREVRHNRCQAKWALSEAVLLTAFAICSAHLARCIQYLVAGLLLGGSAYLDAERSARQAACSLLGHLAVAVHHGQRWGGVLLGPCCPRWYEVVSVLVPCLGQGLAVDYRVHMGRLVGICWG